MANPRHFVEDYVGQTLGSWTVLGSVPHVPGEGFRWLCRCMCGKERPLSASKVVRGITTKCVSCSRLEEPDVWSFPIAHINALQKQCAISGRDFSITCEYLEELLKTQNFKCALSGVPLIARTEGEVRKTASIDRIDSLKGYVPGNVQWVHKDVNKMKNNFDQTYFVEMCRLIAGRDDAND